MSDVAVQILIQTVAVQFRFVKVLLRYLCECGLNCKHEPFIENDVVKKNI